MPASHSVPHADCRISSPQYNHISTSRAANIDPRHQQQHQCSRGCAQRHWAELEHRDSWSKLTHTHTLSLSPHDVVPGDEASHITPTTTLTPLCPGKVDHLQESVSKCGTDIATEDWPQDREQWVNWASVLKWVELGNKGGGGHTAEGRGVLQDQSAGNTEVNHTDVAEKYPGGSCSSMCTLI